MGYFPMCVDLRGRDVLLVGNGPQIADKAEKLRPFGANLRHVDALHESNLSPSVAMVVAGDLDADAARAVALMCRERNILVNVVDMPQLCSFVFPAIIARGDCVVSVSTGGKNPSAAAYLRGRIEEQLPGKTEAILEQLAVLRARFRREYPAEESRRRINAATRAAFALGRPLREDEIEKRNKARIPAGMRYGKTQSGAPHCAGAPLNFMRAFQALRAA